MRLEGSIYKRDSILDLQSVEVSEDAQIPLSKRWDIALLALCKNMNVPIPIWLNKNSREFVNFHQTIFTPEQFAEEVHFDIFQVKLLV